MIKVYSIITKTHLCGEACIYEKDFWEYKIFEPKLEKADHNDEHICAENKYTHYNTTEVHGTKLLNVTLDMYDDLHYGKDDAPCCVKCPDDMIKTYSIIPKNHLCGEACIYEKDFWEYKIFEPKLEKADHNDEHICAENKYIHYNTTEVYGTKLLNITLDMYDNLQ